MRNIAVVAAFLSAGTHLASADPYRWCAVYALGGDAGTNCYFITLEQCQASASGVGGICRPNPFYDGRPVTEPGTASPRGKSPHR